METKKGKIFWKNWKIIPEKELDLWNNLKIRKNAKT
jgi:hypothetical protein